MHMIKRFDFDPPMVKSFILSVKAAYFLRELMLDYILELVSIFFDIM